MLLFDASFVTQACWATGAVSLGVGVGTPHSILFAITHVIVNIGRFGFQLYSLVLHYEKEKRVSDVVKAASNAYIGLISGAS